MLAPGVDLVASEELDDPLGCGRDEAGETDAHTPYIDGVEAVDVLGWVYGLDDLLLVDMLRQRELYDEAMHVWILVEPLDLSEQLLLGDVVLEAYETGAEAYLSAGLDLGGYVGLAAAVMADEDSDEVRGGLA